jgi:hypothetical protein
MLDACEGRRVPLGLTAATAVAEDRDALTGQPAGPGDPGPFGVARWAMLSVQEW